MIQFFKSLTTFQKLLFIVIVAIIIIVIYNLFFKKKTDEIVIIPKVPIFGSGTGSLNSGISNTNNSNNNGPDYNVYNEGPVVNSNIGKTAYAKSSGVKVFNDKSLSTVFKTANKNEWLGKVIDETSVGSSTSKDFWVVSGNKIVLKSAVILK